MVETDDRWLSEEAARRDLGQRTLRGGAVFAVSRTGRGLLDLAATLALARLLSPEEFGLVGLAAAVTGFLTLFQDLGLSTGTIQRPALRHEEVSRLFWINLGLGASLAALTAALAPLLALFFGEPRLLGVVRVLAVGFVFGGAAVQHDALLKRNLRQGRLAGVELAAVAGGGGAGVLFALAGAGAWALVAQTLVYGGLRCALLWWVCDWRPGPPWRGASVREHLRMGGHVTGFTVVNYFARNLDDVLIGRFVGMEALGLYRQAYRLLMLPLRQLNAPIASVARPALARLTDEPERYRRAYLRMLDKVLFLTMPLGGVLLVHAGLVLEVVLGPRWRPAEAMFRWLGLLVFSQPMANTMGWLFISQGRTADMFRWGLVGSSLSMISFAAGLPWGAEGVALAYAGSGLVLRAPLLLWWVGRAGPVSSMDILRVGMLHGTGGILGWAAVGGVAGLLTDAPESVRLLSGVGVALFTQVAVLATVPSGRAALADWWSFASLLGRRRAPDDP